MLHRMSRYIPHFIALSASSPYVQGKTPPLTRRGSTRCSPSCCRAARRLRFDVGRLHRLLRQDDPHRVVKSMKDFYWDIRPKPEFGTIEIRVFDTPSPSNGPPPWPTMQSLGAWFLADEPFMPQEDDYLVYTYNRFQACRFGMEAVYVDRHGRPCRCEHILDDHGQDRPATLRRMAPRTPCTCCAPTPRFTRTMPAGCATASARNSCWPRSAARQRSAFAAHLSEQAASTRRQSGHG